MKRRANKWINYFRLCLLVFLFLCFYNQLATEIFANESFYRDMEQLEASNYNGDGIPTSFYIREGANGTNDGSDWADAWNVLPETLERGAIYYVASGTYSTYIFDDEEVNEEIITIRKATVNDHGTDEGWNNSYASGQALFTAEEGPIFRFITGYYTIDGQTGEGKSGHGIRVYNPLNDNSTVFHGTDISRNLTFEHLEIEGGNWREDETPTTRLMYLTGDLSHMTMRSCYVHEASMQWLYMCRSTDVLIEDSYFENCKRGMGLKIFGSSDQMNVVIRNNTFGNVFNTNNYIQLGEHHQPKSSGYKIYGNVFFMDDPSAKCTFAISNCSHSANDDVLIYNNTFVGVRGSGLNFDNENDTIVASNNLWVDCNPSFGNIKDKNNSKGEFGRDIFINAEEKDFRLRVPLGGAIYLGSEYELDPDGKERGLDGSRDYGAYEFLPDDLSRPIIARQPETMSVKEGDIVTFSVIASSLPAPDYQWQLNGQDIEGEITTTLTLENVQPEDSGYYTVLVSNSEGVTISDSALLIITDEDPQHILQIDFEGNLSNSIDINFRTEWNGTECYMGGINGLAMDTGTTDGNFVKIHNGSLLGGMDELTLTIRARKNILETGGTLIYKDTQYGLSISGNEISGFLTDDRWITFGTSHNLDNINDYEWHHYALVYDGENIIIYVDGQAVGAPQYFPGPVLSNSNPIIIGSDLRGDHFNGQLDEFRIYRRALTEEEIKSLSDVRTYDKSPSIIKQPTEKSAGMGEHVTFSVIASGYSTPTYQWQKNGQDIPGESGASLTITDLQSGDSGEYRVVVSNSEGTVTSNSARLTVISKPPGITSFNSIGEYYTSYLYWENPGDEESWDRIA
ncbi:MAG: immunoglobulin domain-containing protein, partial [Halanaerobiales bacterium]